MVEPKTKYDDDSIENYLPLMIPTYPFGHNLKINQKNLTTIGHVVWDCSRVLSFYFMSDSFKTTMASKGMPSCNWSCLSVLEIGCGPGLAGIQLASLGFNVVLTDLSDVLPLTKVNIEDNEAILQGRASFQELHWSQLDIPEEFLKKDIILSSDCLYEESCIYPLASILRKLAHRKSTILFAFEDRNEEMQTTFFQVMSEDFDWIEIPLKNQHEDYRRSFVYILFMYLKPD